jgi:hypothetical protein
MSTYRYQGPLEQKIFGALPEGEYQFTVAMADPPYEKENGNLVMSVKLTILPDNVPVFCNPWQGTDRNGEPHDQIAEFLLAVNRVPKIGQEPKWSALVGARGRCKLIQEIAQQGKLAGKPVNKVSFFCRPREVGPTAAQQPRSFTKAEVEASRKATVAKAAERDPALDVDPDDIPY